MAAARGLCFVVLLTALVATMLSRQVAAYNKKYDCRYGYAWDTYTERCETCEPCPGLLILHESYIEQPCYLQGTSCPNWCFARHANYQEDTTFACAANRNPLLLETLSTTPAITTQRPTTPQPTALNPCGSGRYMGEHNECKRCGKCGASVILGTSPHMSPMWACKLPLEQGGSLCPNWCTHNARHYLPAADVRGADRACPVQTTIAPTTATMTTSQPTLAPPHITDLGNFWLLVEWDRPAEYDGEFAVYRDLADEENRVVLCSTRLTSCNIGPAVLFGKDAPWEEPIAISYVTEDDLFGTAYLTSADLRIDTIEVVTVDTNTRFATVSIRGVDLAMFVDEPDLKFTPEVTETPVNFGHGSIVKQTECAYKLTDANGQNVTYRRYRARHTPVGTTNPIDQLDRNTGGLTWDVGDLMPNKYYRMIIVCTTNGVAGTNTDVEFTTAQAIPGQGPGLQKYDTEESCNGGNFTHLIFTLSPPPPDQRNGRLLSYNINYRQIFENGSHGEQRESTYSITDDVDIPKLITLLVKRFDAAWEVVACVATSAGCASGPATIFEAVGRPDLPVPELRIRQTDTRLFKIAWEVPDKSCPTYYRISASGISLGKTRSLHYELSPEMETKYKLNFTSVTIKPVYRLAGGKLVEGPQDTWPLENFCRNYN